MRALWPALERRALDLFQALLAAKARDGAARLAAGSCLVLAPHPDDETLGCGGLIRRRRSAGHAVHVAIAADGAASHADEPTRGVTPGGLAALRREETRAACAALGVAAESVTFFDLPDGRLAEVESALEGEIAAALAALRPNDVFVCALVDGHADHRALNAAVRRLIATGKVTANVFEYPVWAFDFRSWRAPGRTNKAGFMIGVLRMLSFVWRTRVMSLDVGMALGEKREALGAHRSQLGRLEDEPEWSALPTEFVNRFFRRRELFFPVHRTPARRPRPETS